MDSILKKRKKSTKFFNYITLQVKRRRSWVFVLFYCWCKGCFASESDRFYLEFDHLFTAHSLVGWESNNTIPLRYAEYLCFLCALNSLDITIFFSHMKLVVLESRNNLPSKKWKKAHFLNGASSTLLSELLISTYYRDFQL